MRNKVRGVSRSAATELPSFLTTFMIAMGLILVWVGLTAI
jgi:hypothetical protein